MAVRTSRAGGTIETVTYDTLTDFIDSLKRKQWIRSVRVDHRSCYENGKKGEKGFELVHYMILTAVDYHDILRHERKITKLGESEMICAKLELEQFTVYKNKEWTEKELDELLNLK